MTVKSIAVLASVVFLVGFVSQANAAEDVETVFYLNDWYGGEKIYPVEKYGPCCFSLTWVNNHKDGHEFKSVINGLFSSGWLAKGGTWTHTFDKPGIYEYYSTLYPQYIFKVVVYNSTTQCTPLGCGVSDAAITMSELLPEIKTEVLQLQAEEKSINTQMSQLDRLILAAKTHNGTWIHNSTNIDGARIIDGKQYILVQDVQNAEKTLKTIQDRVQQISKRLLVLSHNDPLCLTVDIKGDCVYEPAVIQQSFNGPSWINKIFSWNEQGLLSDSEVITILKYLIQNNVITA